MCRPIIRMYMYAHVLIRATMESACMTTGHVRMCVESRPVTKAGSSREDNSTTSTSRSTGGVVTGFEFTGSSAMMLAAAATGLGEEEEKPSTVPSDSDVKAILYSAHHTTTPAPVRRKKEGGDTCTSGTYVCMYAYAHVCALIHKYSGTSLLWTPLGQETVPSLERCPYFRG